MRTNVQKKVSVPNDYMVWFNYQYLVSLHVSVISNNQLIIPISLASH